MSISPCRIHALFIGQPKKLVDAQGSWRSSINRDPVNGPAALELRGFAGDQAAQPYHGTPDLAVCLHSLTHYRYWNSHLQMDLRPGGVGENITLDTWDERHICVGDVLRMGTALIQISAPRTPCVNQARHVGRSDWVAQTIATLRTGMYARVIEPGTLQSGDEIYLELRPNPGLTVHALNDCYYHSFDSALAERFACAEGLMDWWKQRLQKKAEEA